MNQDGKQNSKRQRRNNRNRKSKISKPPSKKEGAPRALKLDERTAKPTAVTNVASSLRSTIHHAVNSPDQRTLGPLIAWVTGAAQSGYYAGTDTPSKLYFALCYAQQLVANAQNGTANISVKIPYWLNCLCTILTPGEAPIEGGMSFESFILNADYSVPTSAIQVGPGTYDFEWLCYVPSGTLGADMFPAAQAPLAYNPDQGSSAFNDVSTFMAGINATVLEHSLVAYGSPNPFKNQMSAFSFPSLSQGFGFGGAGGIAYQANLAVPINCPQLAVFGSGQGTTPFFDSTRYPEYVTVTSGDSLTVGQNLMTHDVRFLYNKKRTFYKPVDFLKFGEVVARWVTGIIQEKFNDLSAAVTGPASYLCPLTLQEVLLLLRNEMMYLYGDTQTGVQSLYPALPTSNTDNQFVPFVAGTTTVALSSSGMQLPIILIENMKSLLARSLGKKGSRDWRCWVPILGKYINDALDRTTFVATYTPPDGSPVPYEVFSSEPTVVHKKKDKLGKDIMIPEVEVSINLIDGWTATNYLFINDPKRLTQLAQKWNGWLSSVKTYSSNVSNVVKDLGSNVLCGLAMTALWNIPSPTERTQEASSFDPRLVQPSRTSSPYLGQRQSAVISHAKPSSAAWTLIQDIWILPDVRLQATNPGALSTVTRIQDIFREGNLITQTSTGEDGIPVVDRLVSYAAMLVRSRSTPPTELELFFEEQNAKGSAGVLSSLAADLLGSVFGPTAHSVAGAVASMLPI